MVPYLTEPTGTYVVHTVPVIVGGTALRLDLRREETDVVFMPDFLQTTFPARLNLLQGVKICFISGYSPIKKLRYPVPGIEVVPTKKNEFTKS